MRCFAGGRGVSSDRLLTSLELPPVPITGCLSGFGLADLDFVFLSADFLDLEYAKYSNLHGAFSKVPKHHVNNLLLRDNNIFFKLHQTGRYVNRITLSQRVLVFLLCFAVVASTR